MFFRPPRNLHGVWCPVPASDFHACEPATSPRDRGASFLCFTQIFVGRAHIMIAHDRPFELQH